MAKNKNAKKTASHFMLFLILGVYFAVAFLGMVFVVVCAVCGDNDGALQSLISLFGYTAACGSSTIIVYTGKASKENQHKLENDKYRIRLEMAKQVFKETAGGTLDERSVALLRSLLYEQENTVLSTVPPVNEISEGVG